MDFIIDKIPIFEMPFPTSYALDLFVDPFTNTHMITLIVYKIVAHSIAYIYS